MNEEHKYIDFESYERVAEPHKRESLGLAYRDRSSGRGLTPCI